MFQERSCVRGSRLRCPAFFAFACTLLPAFRQRRKQAAGREYDDLGNPVRVIEGKTHCHRSRLGMTDETSFADFQSVDKLKDKAPAVGDGIVFWVVAQAESRLVKGDGSQAVARQRSEVALPDVCR